MLKEMFFADKGALGHFGRSIATMGSRALSTNVCKFKVNITRSKIIKSGATLFLREKVGNRYFNQ